MAGVYIKAVVLVTALCVLCNFVHLTSPHPKCESRCLKCLFFPFYEKFIDPYRKVPDNELIKFYCVRGRS